MTVQELKSHFKEHLNEVYPMEEIQSFFNWLADHYLGFSRLDVSLKGTTLVMADQENRFLNALERLKKHEPIQYIIGETEFYGLTFKVTPDTLIPRPETEELVEWILSPGHSSAFLPQKFLDIGTGSGCIAIALAKHRKNAAISAIDVSDGALVVAKQNAAVNKVTVDFFQTDILQATTLPTQFDLIVSNPPYVREIEKGSMQPNVLVYEPESALYVTNEDPLLFYKKIVALALEYLKPKGFLFFEINEYLSDEMEQLLKNSGFSDVTLKKDSFGKYRMIKGRR